LSGNRRRNARANAPSVSRYQKSVFGTYYKRGLLNLQKMDNHIAKMLNDGWKSSPKAHTQGIAESFDHLQSATQ
jgi:hypothetical protein